MSPPRSRKFLLTQQATWSRLLITRFQKKCQLGADRDQSCGVLLLILCWLGGLISEAIADQNVLNHEPEKKNTTCSLLILFIFDQNVFCISFWRIQMKVELAYCFLYFIWDLALSTRPLPSSSSCFECATPPVGLHLKAQRYKTNIRNNMGLAQVVGLYPCPCVIFWSSVLCSGGGATKHEAPHSTAPFRYYASTSYA
jgi:hypothetical protein